MKGYKCECFRECDLTIEDEVWEKARDNINENRDIRSILHPMCPNLNSYEIVEKTDDYIIVVYDK